MASGGSAGTAGMGFRDTVVEESAADANQRRLQWFTDDELLMEVRRRGLATVLHNHTRFQNNGGPWSPCPPTCPVVR
jgi:hypothetical protein